jgi:aminoethylphosphonate catabolism LysR family transcriptional regulator
LKAFHLVATAGGYSQAAREMAVSQPTLSSHVRQLEASSGVSLFERTPRGVMLTADGEALYDITKRLFANLGEAEDFLRAQRSGSGVLRVSADGANLSLPILAKLRERRPDLTFKLVVQNSDRVVDNILQQQADVGISAKAPQYEHLYVRPLVRLRIGVFVLKSHPWARRRDIAMSDLMGCAVVLREQGSRTRAVFEENLARHRIRLGQVLEVSDRDGVREAVANGFGVGAVVDMEFGFDSRLHYLPIRDATVMAEENVICLDERRRQPMIADFIACALEVFGTPAPATTAGTKAPASSQC